MDEGKITAEPGLRGSQKCMNWWIFDTNCTFSAATAMQDQKGLSTLLRSIQVYSYRVQLFPCCKQRVLKKLYTLLYFSAGLSILHAIELIPAPSEHS
jgi:hypothetical protein